jgi:hypothetical protein
MPITREQNRLAASMQINARALSDNSTCSYDILGVDGQGELDSSDTRDQMQQTESDAEQVMGLSTDRIHSADGRVMSKSVLNNHRIHPNHPLIILRTFKMSLWLK